MNPHTPYRSMNSPLDLDRRSFFRAACGVAVGSLVLGRPGLADDPPPAAPPPPPARPETNIADFTRVPRGPHAIPGPFPGRVVQVTDPASLVADKVDGAVVDRMFHQGLSALTGGDHRAAFRRFFHRDDIVGIKVNPVGAPLISTRPELTEAVVRWLTDNGLPPDQIIIWDRFDYMLTEAGFTPERFPGIPIEGLQTMDVKGNNWRDAQGRHLSEDQFDREVFYFAKGVEGKGVRGYKDDEFYLNQHVFNGEYSYFGKLVTQRLTKIINLAAFKNTGNGISMATKNLGYGALCNVGRLHAPLFFHVCTEVLAAPVIRDKLVLNVTDGLRGQYEGGPGMNEQFVYPWHSLYLATDPFAMDTVCHHQLVAKRREMGIEVNEHPRFTEYLHYAEQLRLGVADRDRITHLQLGA